MEDNKISKDFSLTNQSEITNEPKYQKKLRDVQRMIPKRLNVRNLKSEKLITLIDIKEQQSINVNFQQLLYNIIGRRKKLFSGNKKKF